MNQHYTVEMIVARSVDGVEQLMARAGLSHVELYYKRNIFAAKIQAPSTRNWPSGIDTSSEPRSPR